MNRTIRKITLTIVAVLAALAYLAVAIPAHADTVPTITIDGYQTRLVSSYPCYAQSSPVMLLARKDNGDGTYGPWFLVRVIDRWANPNYPCATPTPVVRRGTYRIHPATRKVEHKRVVKVVRTTNGRGEAYFNNGAVWSMRPCPWEDSERCWWDAERMGNNAGRPFVRLFHHTFHPHRVM